MTVLGRNGRARIARAALAATAAAVLTAGCGSSSSTASKSSPAATLKRAAYVSGTAAGYKVNMAMRVTVNGQQSGLKTINLTANGSFTPGARTGEMTMQMQMPTGAGVPSFSMQMVMDKHALYMKMPAALAGQIPGGKPWISVDLAQLGKTANIPGYGSMLNSSSSFSDPGQYLSFLRATADGSVKEVGQETIDGVQTTHYRATIDIAKLTNAVPAAEKKAAQQLASMFQSKGVNTQMPVDAWSDSSHHIRRLQISYDLSIGGESMKITITENMSDYGPQPAPTVPSPDQTTDLTALMHGSPGSLTQSG